MTITHYNATVELDRSARVDDDVVDVLMDTLADVGVVAGASPRGRLEVTVTLPGDSLRQATSTALALVGAAAERIAAAPLTIEVMPTDEADARAGMQPLPELIGSAEAAELLGVSRQRVNQLVEAGQLQGEHVGRALVLPRAAVQAFAGRDRTPGRPKAPR